MEIILGTLTLVAIIYLFYRNDKKKEENEILIRHKEIQRAKINEAKYVTNDKILHQYLAGDADGSVSVDFEKMKLQIFSDSFSSPSAAEYLLQQNSITSEFTYIINYHFYKLPSGENFFEIKNCELTNDFIQRIVDLFFSNKATENLGFSDHLDKDRLESLCKDLNMKSEEYDASPDSLLKFSKEIKIRFKSYNSNKKFHPNVNHQLGVLINNYKRLIRI
ncbi:hypothetical protein [Leptospira kmetyi]|uniref:hypothetical protein n=1 Tax=Leptospira kmetyi TaxID=408139 RepID=UPI00108366E2|nr:hypothetical protein [Leptospira kmetyi]TGL69694.1 hypothetical protein EHQ67_08550 [Leptospira kmetyi]